MKFLEEIKEKDVTRIFELLDAIKKDRLENKNLETGSIIENTINEHFGNIYIEPDKKNTHQQ